MKTLSVITLAIVLSLSVASACPMVAKCPYDGFNTYYTGMEFVNGQCLCHYRHTYNRQVHDVVMACYG